MPHWRNELNDFVIALTKWIEFCYFFKCFFCWITIFIKHFVSSDCAYIHLWIVPTRFELVSPDSKSCMIDRYTMGLFLSELLKNVGAWNSNPRTLSYYVAEPVRGWPPMYASERIYSVLASCRVSNNQSWSGNITLAARRGNALSTFDERPTPTHQISPRRGDSAGRFAVSATLVRLPVRDLRVVLDMGRVPLYSRLIRIPWSDSMVSWVAHRKQPNLHIHSHHIPGLIFTRRSCVTLWREMITELRSPIDDDSMGNSLNLSFRFKTPFQGIHRRGVEPHHPPHWRGVCLPLHKSGD